MDDLRADKRTRGVLDFADQLAWASRLVSEHPAVGAAERERYRVVLLDEYQDTSVAQRLLLTALFVGERPAIRSPPWATRARRSMAGAAPASATSTPFRCTSRWPTGDLRRGSRCGRTTARGGRLLSLANSLSSTLRERHAGLPELVPRPGVELDGHLRVRFVDDVRTGGGLARRRGLRPRRQRRAHAAGRRRARARALRLRAAARRPRRPWPSGRGRRPGRPAVPARGRRPRGRPRGPGRADRQRVLAAAAHRATLADRAA